MKHITILVPKGAILGSIEGPRQVFAEADKFAISTGREPLWKIELAGTLSEVPLAGGKYTVNTDTTINNIERTDLIIIPAIDGNIPEAIRENKEIVDWIKAQYKSGSEVASLCLGAFMLASTGLVSGKKCATHWLAANDFRKMFPDVQLVEDKIITDENGIYSSGGAFSYLNLILYLIEKHAGRDVAVFISKAFQIDIERRSQSPFHIFRGQKDHEDEPVKKTQEFIESNFQHKITVDELADRFALGRRNLERRFKKATSNTLVEYIQRVKIEAAKKNFETTGKNINEVMYEVGYSDTKAFRLTFKKITGMSPAEYRNKYNKEVIVQ